jgi:predicted dehydrogenase
MYQSRKIVLSEKPLVISAEECLKIVKAETEYGKRLVQVGLMH